MHTRVTHFPPAQLEETLLEVLHPAAEKPGSPHILLRFHKGVAV
jgi:hypothetical protein